MKYSQFEGMCYEVCFFKAYQTNCRISPGDCENIKHHHSCLQRLPSQPNTHAVLWCVHVISIRVNWQQTVNTDRDKGRALTRTPPPLPLQKVLCYHGDKAKARASHCWAPSFGVSRTPSQRSDVTQASHLGHHSPAFHLWPQQTLKQIEMGERGEDDRTELNTIT